MEIRVRGPSGEKTKKNGAKDFGAGFWAGTAGGGWVDVLGLERFPYEEGGRACADRRPRARGGTRRKTPAKGGKRLTGNRGTKINEHGV